MELTLAEIIALTRRLTEKDRAMHAGVWDKSASGAHEVRGRTLGIVGYGNIGAQLSVVSEALGMRVVFYDTADKLALGNARRCVSLDELLEASDVVSLHVDGRPSNSSLFGEKEFSRMRPGALFLNLCRGFVIDHDALRTHLMSGHLAGAAVDVFPEEPRCGRRGIRVGPARPAERDPHPAHRRVDRGSAGRHRRLCRQQAGRLRRRGGDVSVGEPAAGRAAPGHRARTGWRTSTGTCPA